MAQTRLKTRGTVLELDLNPRLTPTLEDGPSYQTRSTSFPKKIKNGSAKSFKEWLETGFIKPGNEERHKSSSGKRKRQPLYSPAVLASQKRMAAFSVASEVPIENELVRLRSEVPIPLSYGLAMDVGVEEGPKALTKTFPLEEGDIFGSEAELSIDSFEDRDSFCFGMCGLHMADLTRIGEDYGRLLARKERFSPEDFENHCVMLRRLAQVQRPAIEQQYKNPHEAENVSLRAQLAIAEEKVTRVLAGGPNPTMVGMTLTEPVRQLTKPTYAAAKAFLEQEKKFGDNGAKLDRKNLVNAHVQRQIEADLIAKKFLTEETRGLWLAWSTELLDDRLRLCWAHLDFKGTLHASLSVRFKHLRLRYDIFNQDGFRAYCVKVRETYEKAAVDVLIKNLETTVRGVHEFLPSEANLVLARRVKEDPRPTLVHVYVDRITVLNSEAVAKAQAASEWGLKVESLWTAETDHKNKESEEGSGGDPNPNPRVDRAGVQSEGDASTQQS